MHNRINRLFIVSVLLASAAALTTGCATSKSTGSKEVQVSLSQLPPAARATVERVTTGGSVDKVTKELERGKVVYDVEATVGGKHLEYLIADADGAVLGTEVPMAFDELPAPVRAAAEKFFGTTSGLTVMKGVEYGETSYEIEGLKSGKRVEVTFDPAGKEEK